LGQTERGEEEVKKMTMSECPCKWCKKEVRRRKRYEVKLKRELNQARRWLRAIDKARKESKNV
jgi:hypothetical protein